MQEEAKPSQGKISKIFNHYGLECMLKDETMTIEVTEKQSESIFWTQLSNDTIPEGMKVIFPTPSSIFEFFQEPTDSGQIQIPSLDTIIIKFRVGRSLRDIPIHLSRKELTIQQKLKRKIISLQLEISKLKEKKQFQNFEEIKLQMEVQNQLLTINDQRVQIQNLKETISRLQNKSIIERQIQNLKSEKMLLQEKQERMKIQIEQLLRIQQVNTRRINILQEQNHRYKKEKQNTQTSAIYFQNEIQTHQLIISDLQEQLTEKQIQIAQLTEGKPNSKPNVEVIHQNYGKLLVFEPLESSVNKNCYDFTNNILIKNSSSFNGTGRMIPCTHPIPKNGRYHYKFINKNVGQHPNFRIGVIARQNLASQTYMNGGDVDAVMYYCYNTDKEIIYEGTTKLEGFNIFKGNLMTIVIDRDKKQVQWFVENNFASLTKFTESMKKAENLYFFIQLWSNGDALEMITK